MSLDKIKISNQITKNMTCKKEGHDNRRIEFVCLAPNCQSRLLCTNCLLNDHSEHFKDIVLLEIFLKQEAGQKNCVENEDNKENEAANVEVQGKESEELKQEIIELLSNATIENLKQNLELQQSSDYEYLKIMETATEEESQLSWENCQKFKTNAEQYYDQLQKLIKDEYQNYLTQTNEQQIEKIETKESLINLINNYCNGNLVLNGNKSLQNLQFYYQQISCLTDPKQKLFSQNIIEESKQVQQKIEERYCQNQFTNFEMFAFFQAKKHKYQMKGDLKKLSLVQNYTTNHKKSIYQVLLLDDKIRFATASDDTTIQIWNLEEMKVIQTMSGHTERIWKLVQSQPTILISSGNDQKIKMWSLVNYNCIHTFTGHSHWICSLVLLSPNLLLSTSQDKTLRIWDLEQKKQKFVIKGSKLQKSMCAIVAPSNGLLVGSDRNILHCELEQAVNQGNLAVVRTFQGHTQLLRDLYLTKNLDYLISGSDDKTVRVWNWSSGQLLKTLSGHTHSANMILQLNEKLIATCSDDTTLKIWDFLEGKCVKSLTGHQSWVICMEMFGNDKLVSVSADKTLKVWSVKE